MLVSGMIIGTAHPVRRSSIYVLVARAHARVPPRSGPAAPAADLAPAAV